jgi:hypothetical protein
MARAGLPLEISTARLNRSSHVEARVLRTQFLVSLYSLTCGNSPVTRTYMAIMMVVVVVEEAEEERGKGFEEKD